MFVSDDSQNKLITFRHSIKHLVFVTEAQCVFSEVYTELLNITYINTRLQNLSYTLTSLSQLSEPGSQPQGLYGKQVTVSVTYESTHTSSRISTIKVWFPLSV
jgi:hypothetical protein